MIKKFKEGILLYEFELLQNEKHVIHFVTARQGGFSAGPYYSLNLSNKVGDLPGNVIINRDKLKKTFNLSSVKIYFPDQCHTSIVREVNDNTTQNDLHETDALITNSKNLCILVLTADCVPILLYDPEKKAIGVVHSGWKGTVSRIVVRVIEKMVKLYGIKPQNLFACIGPSISLNHYEVGDEVVDQFKFCFADTPSVFMKNKVTGKAHIDLWEANRQLLLRIGVLDANIQIGGICTYDESDQFFSARRDGIECGRFASGIMLI